MVAKYPGIFYDLKKLWLYVVALMNWIQTNFVQLDFVQHDAEAQTSSSGRGRQEKTKYRRKQKQEENELVSMMPALAILLFEEF